MRGVVAVGQTSGAGPWPWRRLVWRAVVLTAALCGSALAAPGPDGAVYAADFRLSGSLESAMTWRQRPWLDEVGFVEEPAGVKADTTLRLTGVMGTPENGLRAVVELSPQPSFLPQDPGSVFGLGQFGVKRAYLEAAGQLWPGGSPVTARLGTLEVRLSPYIGTFQREGLSLSGLRYGPVQAAAFVGRDVLRVDPDDPLSLPISEPFTVAGGQVLVDVSRPVQSLARVAGAGWPVSAAVGVTGLNVGSHGLLELGFGASPYPGVMMTGVAAWDTSGGRPVAGQVRPATSWQEAPRMYRLDAVASVIQGVTLTASYRQVSNVFDPLYQEVLKDADGKRVDWLAENRGETGVVVGAETTYRGVALRASLDNYERWVDENGQPVGPEGVTFHREAGLEAGTTVRGVELAGRTLWDVAAGVNHLETKVAVGYPINLPGLQLTPRYEATVDRAGVSHTLAAVATADLPYFPGLRAQGKLTREADGSLSWAADLGYRAPNGLAVGVHHSSDKGAWVDAGVAVRF